MIRVLGLLICVMTASCMGWNLIVLGLSLKNFLLYIAVSGLILQMVLGRPPKMELSAVQVCLAVLLGYAILTTFIVSFSGHMPRYSVVGAGRALKASLIDWILFFLVMFYGSKSAEDAAKLMKILLVTVGLAQLVTLWDAVGLPQIGNQVLSTENSDRVAGFFGNSNETGTMIATMLPAYVVAVLERRGASKIFWAALLGASVTVMLATLSRGAVVSLLVGSLWASLLCRRYISFSRSIQYALIAAAVAVPILLVAGGGYVEGLIDRFTRVSTVSASDVTSGRTIIWSQAFEALSSNPMYFVTGVGWNTWFFSGMLLGPHNQYLSLYFELGVVGLFSYVLLLRNMVRAPLRALKAASIRHRAMLVSLVFSVLILSVGLLFAALGVPWVMLWIFFALSLRMVVGVPEEQPVIRATSNDVARRAPVRTMIPARQSRKPSNAA